VPKVKASATVLSSVIEIRNPSGAEVDPERRDRRDVISEIAAMETLDRLHVMQYMAYATEMGFPLDTAEVMRRVIDAGLKSASRERDANTREAIAAELKASTARPGSHAPLVYYMRRGELVKIGTTTNIGSRFTSVSPDGIMAIEPGSYDVEAARHLQFRPLWRRGEWYELKPELAEHVVQVREDFAQLVGSSTEDWLVRRIPKRRTSKGISEST